MAEVSEEIEKYRDKKWRREETLKISKAVQVEELVEDLGFCFSLTDSRTELPSIYVAVCGRRDVHSPKNVQKDPECSLAWVLKDEVMQRGNVYYSKLVKGRAMFVAPRLVPHFNAIYGVPKSKEKERLSVDANKILQVLRKEWESSTSDLREETKIEERKHLTKALEELQKCMKVVAYEVLYKPKFTYLWTLAEARFPDLLSKKISRNKAVKELAKSFLLIRGIVLKGEFAKTFGLSKEEAIVANCELVDDGFAEMSENEVLRIKGLSI